MIEPKEVSDVMMAFPANVIGEGYLPAEEDIPKEFWGGNEWSDMAQKWFMGVLSDPGLISKEGIDAQLAGRHCQAVLGSYEPKHEHKIAGVGYLMSEFFEKVGSLGEATG